MRRVCLSGISILWLTRCIHVALTQNHQSPSLLSRDLCYFALRTEFEHLNMRSYYLYLIHTTSYQSYNRLNGYIAFALPCQQGGPSTAAIALKSNWIHACGEGKPFLILLDIFSKFCMISPVFLLPSICFVNQPQSPLIQ